MVKKAPESKTSMVCAQCGAEFTGKKCPECGNTKENTELASDGIPVASHASSAAFGTASGLRPTGEALSEEYLMSKELALGQREELHDNLREAVLLKSEMKRMDLEAKLKERKLELEPQHVPRAAPQQPEPQPIQMPNMFQPNTMNPQAQFMNQFMKMNTDERTEFLEQLGEADPQALSTLSGFFTQQQPAMQQQMPMNPFMPQQMNPYMQYPPPWAQQQQYEQQGSPKDPTEAAISMVDKLQEMSERGRRNEPSESTVMVEALRDELKALNERISSMNTETQNSANDALMQRIGQMESHLYTSKPSGGLKDQIHEIKEMVTDLQDIGMMSKPDTGNTVEEQIQLDQAKHNIKKEDRQLELQQQQADLAVASADMKKNLVSGMFGRHLRKTMGQPEENTSPPSVPQTAAPPIPRNDTYNIVPQEGVVVEEFSSDAGTVRETRPPVRDETQ